MNWLQLLSTDTAVGRLLHWSRAVLDIVVLLVRNPSRESLFFARMILKLKPRYTMVTNGNLIALYRFVEQANRERIPGDLVQCGVWNGGSAALMGLAQVRSGTPGLDRRLWLFDSFEGLPPPGGQDGRREREQFFKGLTCGRVEAVRSAFRRVGVPFGLCEVVKGWFQDTFPATPVGPIALLHVDADWYDSVKLCLDTYYDRVAPGGFVVLDDYHYWEGCDRAVRDFLRERGLTGIRVTPTDRAGGCFRKPQTAPVQ